MFKTISKDSTAEIVEKKSRFIANVFYVESIEEAEKKIKQIKKKYFDAKHNCFAYSIYSENGNICRCSDDGEPSGTAGAPMLNIITSNELTNVLVIVTRYFGGVLLGTGGLVRAYTSVFQESLKKVNVITKVSGLEVILKVYYQDLEKIKYYLRQSKVEIIDINYNENIELNINISKEEYDKLLKNLKNLNFKIIESYVLKEKSINYYM